MTFFKNPLLVGTIKLFHFQIKKTTFGASEYVFPFEEEGEKQRWTSIKSLSLEELTFPVDKLVFDKLKKEFH